jgi:predicted DsbA family dithiol-disulfide isomerase
MGLGHHRRVDPLPLTAEMWVDVICPWAYLGLDRTRLLRELGIGVTLRAYELHPDLPLAPRRIQLGGRLETVHRRIAGECAEVGLPFRVPTTIVNSHQVLEWAEAVAEVEPAMLDRMWERLFRARFVEDRLLDGALLEELTHAVGLDPSRIASAVGDGVGGGRLAIARTEAHEAGIAATPGWRFSNGFVVVGVQPREQFRRWAIRMLEGIGDGDAHR